MADTIQNILAPSTSSEQEALQNAALGNCTADNQAVARTDPDVDVQTKSVSAEDVTGTASVQGGVVTATEQPSGAQSKLYGDGTLLGYSYEIDPDMFEGIEAGNPTANTPVLTPLSRDISGGRLFIPPTACPQIQSGANTIRLDSEDDEIHFIFDVKERFTLDSLSLYFSAIADGGDLSLELYDALGSAVEQNGQYNGKTNADDSAPTMTSNSTPSPYVTSATSEAVGYEAWKAYDKLTTTDDCWRSTAVPSEGSPQELIIDLGESNTTAYNKVILIAANTSVADTRAAPKTFYIFGSMDGVTYTQLFYNANVPVDVGAAGRITINFLNSTAYRYIKFRFVGSYGSASVSVGLVILVPVGTGEAPGTLLHDFGNFATGSSVGWVRNTYTGYTLETGRYILVIGGATGVDATLVHRRATTIIGSDIPCCVMCKSTTDGGVSSTPLMTIWNQGRPTMLGIILNSSVHHVPELHFGQFSGSTVTLPGVGVRSIPDDGIRLNMESLTAGTGYYVYAYDNAGELAIEASATTPVQINGVYVKTGETDRLLIGYVAAINYISTYQGPVDVMGYRGIFNVFNKQKKVFGKQIPYVNSTTEILPSVQPIPSHDWRSFGSNGDDFKIKIACLACAFMMNIALGGSGQINVAVGVNDKKPHPDPYHSFGSVNAYGLARFNQNVQLNVGINSLWPLLAPSEGIARTIYYNYHVYRAEFFGEIEC